MKPIISLISIILLTIFCTGCSKKIEGSYKRSGVMFGRPFETRYDFNKDGTVVYTNFLGERFRGKYSVNANTITLVFTADWEKGNIVELIREGDVLMEEGEYRFARE